MDAKEHVENLRVMVKHHVDNIAEANRKISELEIIRATSLKRLTHFQELLAAELSQVSA